jgi:hypothetical protein
MKKNKQNKFVFGKDHYFVVRFNLVQDILFSLLFSVLAAFIYLLLFEHTFDYLSFLLSLLIKFVLVFLFKIIIYNNIKPNIKIKNGEFEIGETFKELIENLLSDLDIKDKNERIKKVRETSYFLKTNNSRTGKTFQFDPDNTAIDQLHKVQGLISVTEANPSEWLNPTYNFFLVNNYLASISQSILKNAPVESIAFSENRSEKRFVDFKNNKKKILEDLSGLDMVSSDSLMKYLRSNKIFVRFYILETSEIENNKSIIETLIAGHDLFGCYIYFINKKIYDLINQNDMQRFRNFISSIGYNLEENKKKIDLAVAFHDNALEVIYRKQDDLTVKTLDERNSNEFQCFITTLSKLLYNNYDNDNYLFDVYFSKNNYMMNESYCHIIYNKCEKI